MPVFGYSRRNSLVDKVRFSRRHTRLIFFKKLIGFKRFCFLKYLVHRALGRRVCGGLLVFNSLRSFWSLYSNMQVRNLVKRSFLKGSFSIFRARRVFAKLCFINYRHYYRRYFLKSRVSGVVVGSSASIFCSIFSITREVGVTRLQFFYYLKLRSLFLRMGKSGLAVRFLNSCYWGLKFFFLKPLEVLLLAIGLAGVPFFLQRRHKAGKVVKIPYYTKPARRNVVALRVLFSCGLGRSRYVELFGLNYCNPGLRVAAECGDVFLGNPCNTERFLVDLFEVTDFALFRI